MAKTLVYFYRWLDSTYFLWTSCYCERFIERKFKKDLNYIHSGFKVNKYEPLRVNTWRTSTSKEIKYKELNALWSIWYNFQFTIQLLFYLLCAISQLKAWEFEYDCDNTRIFCRAFVRAFVSPLKVACLRVQFPYLEKIAGWVRLHRLYMEETRSSDFFVCRMSPGDIG